MATRSLTRILLVLALATASVVALQSISGAKGTKNVRNDHISRRTLALYCQQHNGTSHSDADNGGTSCLTEGGTLVYCIYKPPTAGSNCIVARGGPVKPLADQLINLFGQLDTSALSPDSGQPTQNTGGGSRTTTTTKPSTTTTTKPPTTTTKPSTTTTKAPTPTTGPVFQ